VNGDEWKREGGGGVQEKQRPPQQKHVHCTVRVGEKNSKCTARKTANKQHLHNRTTARPAQSSCGRLDQRRRRCRQQGKTAAQLTFKSEQK